MLIDKKIDGNSITLIVSGRLDTATAPEFESMVTNGLTGAKELILDLEKLEYVSSAGLRVILKAQKIMNEQGSMKVIHVNEIVMEVFDITGFADILTIE